ncbi:MAG: sodium-dependent transporter [Endomicrobium sp.]|jgi:NSS family neurotransmitter:Na+ symporter|nr:sodium-dependent transporter [Endomicrobium sp.]
MAQNSDLKDVFSSKWGFILACAGSAVGMGNIWLFPYRAGELGGAAFLIPYIICVIVLGFIAIIGEISIGRLTGTGPVGAFKKVMRLRGKNGKIGEYLGWIAVIVVFIIALGYTVIVAWVIRFLFGAFSGASFYSADSSMYFELITNGGGIIFWIFITLLLVVFSMARGVEKGIEQISKVLMPAFILLFLVLAVRVAFLENASQGYKYLLLPRWEFLFNPKTWILALGQAFYSLSIFGSIMIVFGSYAQKSENIISSAKNIVIIDTISSIIASLVIIPAVFAFGKNISAGPSLMFITMPDIFKTLPFGQIFMIIFFTAVFFAAITSLISILEVVIETLQNRFNMKRSYALVLTAALIMILNLFIKGNISGFMDLLEIHFVPFCALMAGIFVFWILPPQHLIKEIQSGRTKPAPKWLLAAGRYVFCPLIIILYVLNILHAAK